MADPLVGDVVNLKPVRAWNAAQMRDSKQLRKLTLVAVALKNATAKILIHHVTRAV